MVSFERIDADLDIEISVETRYRILAPREAITIPAVFGILGLSAIIGGLVLAKRIEALYDEEVYPIH